MQQSSRHASLVALTALAVLATITLGSAAVNWIYHETVTNNLQEIRMTQNQNAGSLTSSWISGGTTISWTSTWMEHDPDETWDEFKDRHKEEVADLKEDFPPDPPAGD